MTQHSSGECNVWPELRTMALGGNFSFFFFFKQLIYLFLERGEGREKEREKYQCVVASHVAPTGDLACNPGMCLDWESNWQPFGLQPALNSLSYTSQGQNINVLKLL